MKSRSKYTRSRDGLERMNIWTSIRVTREELADLNKKSRDLGFRNVQDYMSNSIANAIRWDIHEEHGERLETPTAPTGPSELVHYEDYADECPGEWSVHTSGNPSLVTCTQCRSRLRNEEVGDG